MNKDIGINIPNFVAFDFQHCKDVMKTGNMLQFSQSAMLTILAQNCMIVVMAQMNISLPEALKKWAEMRVAEGRYSSTSDLVRDLLRKDQDSAVDETAWLQAMIDEGLASETLKESPYQVIEDIIAESRATRDAV